MNEQKQNLLKMMKKEYNRISAISSNPNNPKWKEAFSVSKHIARMQILIEVSEELFPDDIKLRDELFDILECGFKLNGLIKRRLSGSHGQK